METVSLGKNSCLTLEDTIPITILVSESPEESKFLSDRLAQDGVRFVWTSGRKCNFEGCDQPHLQPINVNGWFWSGSGVRLGPTNDPSYGAWSHTGGGDDPQPQPDNREERVTVSERGEVEMFAFGALCACLDNLSFPSHRLGVSIPSKFSEKLQNKTHSQS